MDLRARLPGRGAWVHPVRGCVETVERNPKGLKRALRGPVQVTGLGDLLRVAVWSALTHGLSQAAAGGQLIGGHDRLVAALSQGRVAWLVTASDASGRTLDSVARADDEVPIVALPLDREALGRQVGHPARAALGVLASAPTVHLRRQLRRWRSLG